MSDRAHGGELKQDFGNDFAASAFRQIDGETRIVGKFGQITQYGDGKYDVWFIAEDRSPLSGQRLSRIQACCAQQEGRFRRLDGEAWTRGVGRQFVIDMAVLAGVKRKRHLSPENQQMLRDRLAGMRRAAA